MTGCWQHTTSDWCLVHRAYVILNYIIFYLFLCYLFFRVCRFQPNVRNFWVEDLIVWLVQALVFFVPPGAVEEETVHVATISRRLTDIKMFLPFTYYRKFEQQGIDWLFVFSGEVLQYTGKERLSEEETWNPEIRWSTLIDPFLHEFKPLNEIVDPAAQRFQARIGRSMPNIRNLVVEQTIEY